MIFVADIKNRCKYQKRNSQIYNKMPTPITIIKVIEFFELSPITTFSILPSTTYLYFRPT